MSSSSLYDEAFKIFLSLTNEKEKFLEQLEETIQFNEPKNLLDIGAGDGSMALPLSKLVSSYVAVEKNKDYAAKLKAEGLNVAEGDFLEVCGSIEWKFDLVLISHSLPGTQEKREKFIEKAADMVTGRGRLVIVTYDDDEPSWSHMLSVAGLEKYQGRVVSLKEFLERKFRRVYTKEITTYVTARSPWDMLRALAFVYSNGKEQRFQNFTNSKPVLSHIMTKFHNGEKLNPEVKFPFKHVWFTVRK